MTIRRLATAFLGIVLGLYLLLSVPVLVFASSRSTLAWFLFAVSYSCLALALAFDLAEVCLGSVLAPTAHPSLRDVDRRQARVAVLYLCCDDLDTESLRNLAYLDDMDVFVLDDSEQPRSRRQADHSGLNVVRREGRVGFKAGNLNHWLERYAGDFRYFVVLDSDSLMTDEGIWELVAYAEHPQNRDVAIVQSSILPRAGNRFQRLIGSQARPRLHVLRRLYDRIGWSLSHGHNNLHRTAAILDVGGFGLAATCEDTVISLALGRRDWRIILVDTVSHDAEPDSAFSFRRREVRWARQTADTIRAFSGGVTWQHRCLLARHLLSYLVPLLSIVLLGFVAITADLDLARAWQIARGDLLLETGFVLSGLLSYLLVGSFTLVVLLRLRLFLLSGGDLRTFFSSALLAGAMYGFNSLSVTLGVVRSLLFGRTGFSPTGRKASRDVRLVAFWRAMMFSWVLYVAIALLFVSKSGLLLLGFNLPWTATLVTAPAVLWRFHSDQREDSAY
jgi:hypothetical protein